MDLTKALSELYEERRRLDSAISALESMLTSEPANEVRRRGRKSMGAMERLVVSERMKRYWASRREQPVAMAASIDSTVSV
ncbi:MAG: hypothetical protein SFV54_00520 [Bryobacteraceae bacterium]|nr:hypothetical protein [Bryobacteraceae bacterium]